ncbi:MAG: aspartyl/glutamyl-tRNA amidotransferase subunit A [Pirellulaceae bacterium]|nr:aspartyl/glutamyl-tRNA amidotransferase subunit A [Pirellulaceae bacterium]
MSLIESTAAQLHRQLTSGNVTSVEVTQSFLDHIQQHDEHYSAFISLNVEAALAQAEDIDRRRASGKPVGALGGLPVAVKDVICTKGQTTTCGSKMLRDFVPPYDATVVCKLKQADGVLLGKTNMDEFAMGSSTENSAFGVTHNPWDRTCVPGGSSGGAAACVAARMAPLSVGTDTGGSIRQPAAFCGVTGMKPTYGRVSRFGLVAFASSLDQIGPIAQTAEDAALLLQALAGHDPNDSTSSSKPVPDFLRAINQPLVGLKIGVIREHFGEGLDDEVAAAVREAVHTYQALGATVSDISLPHNQYAIATYYVIAPSEASSNLARYDGVHYGFRANEAEILETLKQERDTATATNQEATGKELDSELIRMYQRTRSEGFGSEVQRRIMLGVYALSEGYASKYYLKALKVRRLIRQDFDKAFEKVDLIVGPTSPTPAYPIGDKIADPLSMYLGDLYTVSANLAGIAGISIPCGFSKTGLPIGLQLQAPAFEEERLLQAAHMFQQQTDWHTKRPSLKN